MTQKIAVLIYFAAEAWNHAYTNFFYVNIHDDKK